MGQYHLAVAGGSTNTEPGAVATGSVTIRNELIVTGPGRCRSWFCICLALRYREVVLTSLDRTLSICAPFKLHTYQLVFEMSDASKNHCDVVFGAGRNHFGVAH